MSVLLPDPDGPMMATISPSFMTKSRPWSTGSDLSHLVRLGDVLKPDHSAHLLNFHRPPEPACQRGGPILR
jgi:hypothetical protein